jgi:hypothetical protein
MKLGNRSRTRSGVGDILRSDAEDDIRAPLRGGQQPGRERDAQAATTKEPQAALGFNRPFEIIDRQIAEKRGYKHVARALVFWNRLGTRRFWHRLFQPILFAPNALYKLKIDKSFIDHVMTVECDRSCCHRTGAGNRPQGHGGKR